MDNISFISTELDVTDATECLSLSNSNECLSLLNCDKTNKSSLTILTVNIRSLNCNFDRFIAYVSNLDILVDVFVLTECWTSLQNSPPSIDNYNMFWTQVSLNQNDGVVAYIREEISVVAYEPSVITDGNCLVLNISPNYAIICTYRSPSIYNASKYLESLDNLLQNITVENIILTGDINLNILADNINHFAQDYLNIMAMHGMRQGINRPTRLTACLDHFMVKTRSAWKTIVFEQTITDHSPILLYIYNSKIVKRDIKFNKVVINYEEIKKSLEHETWESLYNLNNVNLVTEIFTSNLCTIINNNTFIKILSKKNQPLKPWITYGIVKSIRKRDKLHMRTKKNPDDIELKEKYVNYRNICNKIIRNLKREYYKSKLLKCQGNVKQTWKIVKDVCNLQQTKAHSRELLRIGSDPNDSLNIVNTYFTNVGKLLAAKTLSTMNVSENELALRAKSSNPPVKSMMFSPTDLTEIKNIIFELKTNSAPGWDKITSNILKQFIIFLVEPIAFLCNLSLETGIFPLAMKKAIVCPIFKAGDKTKPSNYRPISLLSTLSKVLEKLVKKRVVRYLESNCLLNNNQYGFREGKSTEDAVLTLTSLITSHLDAGNKCIGVFLDLQKAFDTVSIPILLQRLENIGIRGLVLTWFSDYLLGRSQHVHIDGHMSEMAQCNFGVPQGSTLGPILFLIYINDLCCTTQPGLDLLMFADDTVLLVHEKTWGKVKEVTERYLANIMCWLENNILSLNTDKTNYLCFSKTAAGRPDYDFNLRIHAYPCNRNSVCVAGCNCAILSRRSVIKYLGVHIDDRLNWVTHINTLASRIRKMIYVFKNLRTVADMKLVTQTYKALCECLIRYCICAWGGAASCHFITVERAQRAVLKVMMYLPFRHPTANVYEKSNVLTVRKLFIYESLRRYHRKVVPFLPKQPTKRLDKCPVPTVKSRFAHKHYDVIAPRLYNSFNKIYKVKTFNNHKIKKYIKLWLMSFDYNGVERMLANL